MEKLREALIPILPAIERALDEQPEQLHSADEPRGNITVTWYTSRETAEQALALLATPPARVLVDKVVEYGHIVETVSDAIATLPLDAKVHVRVTEDDAKQ